MGTLEEIFLAETGKKRCIRCGKCKPISEFHKLSVLTPGTGRVTPYRPDCKTCRNAYEKSRVAYHMRER